MLPRGVSPGVEEQPHELKAALAGCKHERSASVLIHRVDLRACLQQPCGSGLASLLYCKIKRCPMISVLYHLEKRHAVGKAHRCAVSPHRALHTTMSQVGGRQGPRSATFAATSAGWFCSSCSSATMLPTLAASCSCVISMTLSPACFGGGGDGEAAGRRRRLRRQGEMVLGRLARVTVGLAHVTGSRVTDGRAGPDEPRTARARTQKSPEAHSSRRV